MSSPGPKAVILPCSGIGKTAGSVAREAGYQLCEVLRPDATRLVALSKLVLGDESARALLSRCPAITIDGCAQLCAAKLVKLAGGTVARQVTVPETYRRHRELKSEGIAELNAKGKQLASVIAEEIATIVDGLDDGAPGGGSCA